MNIVKHSSCNRILGVSEAQAAAGVVPLPVRRCTDEDELPIIQSFWRPDEAELKALNAGHPIIVTLQGHTHAPLKLEVAETKE